MATRTRTTHMLAVVGLFCLFIAVPVRCNMWDHDIDLDENFRLLWSVKQQDIYFEVQVRTQGYVGLGFSRDGTIYGADMAVGWVEQGHAYFQDRHVKPFSDGEPIVDPSQDYVLLLGFENATHTVLRFKRKLDTCDLTYDVPITNDTIRLIYMYYDDEPKRGRVVPGSLPNTAEAYKTSRAIYLTQYAPQAQLPLNEKAQVLELRNQDVELPLDDSSLHWCKMFKVSDINRKHHMIRYEPVFESPDNVPYLNHIILYECQGSSPELEIMSREIGHKCFESDDPPMVCNEIVASWARGSEGFTYPNEAGYELNSNQARFFLMETHYQNPFSGHEIDPQSMKNAVDSSGLRLYYTANLRTYDAGVLSIGLDPNWRHIIPPEQSSVVSEGHCVEECTQSAFPKTGINIFAATMRTHGIGKKVRLRHIRGAEELAPIVQDSNFDVNHQEYLRLGAPVKALPGDRMIAECQYDSTSRSAITLGGLSASEETCLVLTLYYPRQRELTSCHSLPSFSTVLKSVGIEKLTIGSNPVTIELPPELAGMTLETRLMTYDWKNEFDHFQAATASGSLKPICWSARKTLLSGTDTIDSYSPVLKKTWHQPPTCSFKNLLNYKHRNHYVTESEDNADQPNDTDNNDLGALLHNKVSRSSVSEKMSFSGSISSLKSSSFGVTLLLLFFVQALRLR